MIAWPTGAMEPAEFPSQFPPTHFQSPIQATWVLGALEGGRGDQERQAGGALQDQRAIAPPTWTQGAC